MIELGEPHNSAVVRTTVINMPREVSVPDHVVWFSALFLNTRCCWSFIVYAHSVKSRDRKTVGDGIGAQAYTSTVKRLNISSLVFRMQWSCLHRYWPHHLCGSLSSLLTENATSWVLVLPCASQSTAGPPPRLKL